MFMDTIIGVATTTFQTTTGFSFDDLVQWAGDQLVFLLGSGLGLVDAMLAWIVAIVVIGVIIGLIYHGLRWMKILR